MNATIGNLALATEGLSLGVDARPYTVGFAGVAYDDNPVVGAMLQAVQGESDVDGIEGRSMDREAVKGVTAAVPQSVSDFVRMYASPDGRGGISDFVAADSFVALQSAWNEKNLKGAKSRMIHSFWVYASLMAFSARTKESLARFEGANPGRGEGTILHRLAKGTHTAWLNGEKNEPYYVPFNQGAQELVLSAIDSGYLPGVDRKVFVDPKKKFKLKREDFKIEDAREAVQFADHFRTVTGAAFDSGFMLNTVGGEWGDLLSVTVPENGDWKTQRALFLFGLQTDNVASVLYGLENEGLLRSLSEGSPADRLQSLVEMLRLINVAWRVNNPWGGMNSPLINRRFALAEDGGIGIGDIIRDALTLRSTLEELEAARLQGQVALPEFISKGLETAFANGLEGVLEAMANEAVLAEAVRVNTRVYDEAPDPREKKQK